MFKVAVASGKGGTGKTFVSTNLFRILEQEGRDVALVDCDAEVPNDAIFFGMEKYGEKKVLELCPGIVAGECTFCGDCAEWCSYHAIVCVPSANYIRILPDICHGCGACLHACACGAVVSAFRETGIVSVCGWDGRPRFFEGRIVEGTHSPVSVIRETVTSASGCGADCLIIDAPPGCACPFVSAVAEADYVVLVTEPTPFGLNDLRNTVRVLRTMDKLFGVVVNRAGIGSEALGKWLEKERIEVLAEIPYAPEIASLYAGGELAVDKITWLRGEFAALAEKMRKYESRGSQW